MRTHSRLRKILFAGIAIALPFLLVLMLEGILRIAGYGDQYPFFTEDPGNPYRSVLDYTRPGSGSSTGTWTG
jgi:hypothetical protein